MVPASIGADLSRGQAQNGVNFDFEGQSTRSLYMGSKFGDPSLNIWTDSHRQRPQNCPPVKTIVCFHGKWTKPCRLSINHRTILIMAFVMNGVLYIVLVSITEGFVPSPKAYLWPQWVNILRPRQNGRRFADDTFKRIFVNENVTVSKFPCAQLTIYQHRFR